MQRDARENARYAGPANYDFQRGTSSIYGSVYDRGTAGGNYDEFTRYPKGLRTNTAGTAVLVNLSRGTVPFVLAAGETLLYKWVAIAATSSLTHGTSSVDNFVIIWD